jgi:methionyl-tRNA formyltransferase
MRVLLFASAPPAAFGFSQSLVALGHEVPALVSYRGPEGRYGPGFPFALHEAAPGADLIFVSSGRQLAGLLAAYSPDLAFCGSFPIKIPDDALAVPRLGIINAHPALLPRYRGPNPMGWAIRNDESALGMTLHRMTSEYDSGAIYAQSAIPLADDEDPATEGIEQFQEMVPPLVADALQRVEAGDPGDPQDESQASYAPNFEPEYLEVDWTQPARAIHNQTRAWKLAPPTNGTRGPLTTLNGQRIRLLRTQLDGQRGGQQVDTGDGPLWIVESEPV